MKSFKKFLSENAPTEQIQLTPASTTGKVQYRMPDGEWQDVEGYVPQGAEIRTGLKSSLTLNPDTDKSTTMGSGQIKKVPSEGEQFDVDKTTTIGKKDFKVDRVGLSTDFKVLPPSTTMAVRG